MSKLNKHGKKSPNLSPKPSPKISPTKNPSISNDNSEVIFVENTRLKKKRLSISVTKAEGIDPCLDFDSDKKFNKDKGHLLVPTKEQTEHVEKLIKQRRASTIVALGAVFKHIFIKKKMEEDGIPALVMDKIWVGSIGAAKNKKWLKDNKITHILNAAGNFADKYLNKKKEKDDEEDKNKDDDDEIKIIYKNIDILDNPTADIKQYFEETYEFIEKCLKNENGKILIHCFAGVSRSVTLTAAYMIKKYKLTTIKAIKKIKNKRKQANPNPGFILQLIRYQKNLGIPNDPNDNIHILDESDAEADNNDDNNNNNNDKKEKLEVKNKLKPTRIKINNVSSKALNQWEGGRRPSLFEALNKLKALRNRANSNDSSANNISDDDDDKESNENSLSNISPINIQPWDDNSNNNNDDREESPVSPMPPLKEATSLQEQSDNETSTPVSKEINVDKTKQNNPK